MKLSILLLAAFFITACSTYDPPPEPIGSRIAVNSPKKIHELYKSIIEREEAKKEDPNKFPEIPNVNEKEFKNHLVEISK